jgi:hypothetical protein
MAFGVQLRWGMVFQLLELRWTHLRWATFVRWIALEEGYQVSFGTWSPDRCDLSAAREFLASWSVVEG